MLELNNQSAWAAGLFPGFDRDRHQQMTAVFKAGFAFDERGKLTPLPEVPDIIKFDEFHGDPLKSSVKKAAETAAFKQGSEVYLYGTAVPPRTNLTAMEVGMGILFTDGREWKKILRVFGKRTWKKTLMNYAMETPGFVEPTPLRYENAFGGRLNQDSDDGYQSNPVGVGYNKDARQLNCSELPRLEVGPNFLSAPVQLPIPAGFGPLAAHWEPRVSEIGNPFADPTDQGGCPYTEQTKPTCHHVAPLDQRFAKPFVGGEVIHLRALLKDVSHAQTVQIVLPKLHVQLYSVINGDAQTLNPVCDTLVIDTDERQLFMIYRAGIAWRFADRRKGWVMLKDLELKEQLPNDKERKDAPRMATI